MPEKIERLKTLVEAMGSVLVTFSGGLDSAFLLKIAADVLGERALGLTAVSPSLSPAEREDTVRVARAMGARHVLVDSHEHEDPSYTRNSPDRCFHCKSELYRVAAAEAAKHGLAFVANGTNVDDLGDYRPGLDAAAKAGVRSPLVEAGLTKIEIRKLARDVGLDIWDKPASACLSSRIPYGTAVTTERLSQVARLEQAIRALGIRHVRVRYHAPLARIEVDQPSMQHALDKRADIVRAGRAVGFTFVTLDLDGYRVGSLNELIEHGGRPPATQS